MNTDTGVKCSCDYKTGGTGCDNKYSITKQCLYTPGDCHLYALTKFIDKSIRKIHENLETE